MGAVYSQFYIDCNNHCENPLVLGLDLRTSIFHLGGATNGDGVKSKGGNLPYLAVMLSLVYVTSMRAAKQ